MNAQIVRLQNINFVGVATSKSFRVERDLWCEGDQRESLQSGKSDEKKTSIGPQAVNSHTRNFVNLLERLISHELVARSVRWNEVATNRVRLTVVHFHEPFGIVESTVDDPSI